MADPTFLTLPEELLELGAAGDDFFRVMGYSVAREKADLEFPYRPALYCRRNRTRLLVEVLDAIDAERMAAWTSFGRSCTTDTRVGVLLPVTAGISAEDIAFARKSGFAIYRKDNGHVHEFCPPVDLALQLDLPDLRRYSNPIRAALGPAYEQIRRGNWIEGFEDACSAVEDAARKYLLKHSNSGRITVTLGKKRARQTLTKAEIDSLPLGALKDRYLAIDSPNHSDTEIGNCLKQLNPDRIRAAHKKRDGRSERALRQNVGRQMWLVLKALSELLP